VSTRPGGPGRYPPIADHAVLGDGHALALLDREGTLDWMILPEDERVAVFSSLLDPSGGGQWCLAPTTAYEARRHYVGHSAVLRTVLTTAGGAVEVVEGFTLRDGALLPWVELVRRVRLLRGQVSLAWSLATTGLLGAPPASFVAERGLLRCRVGRLGMAVRAFGAAEATCAGPEVLGRVAVSAEHPEALLALVVVDGAPLVRPDHHEVAGRLESTTRTWQHWAERIEVSGPAPEAVRASARTLKLLVHHRTGSPLAAATTSLPEDVGGDRNYDYRYCWIRDASLTVDALLGTGLVEEAHHAVVTMLAMARATRPDLAPLYTVAGDQPPGSRTLALPGYAGSRPVRVGNDAHDQLQLGIWFDLFDALWRYVERGNELDPPSGSLVAELADRLCDRWREPDSGIWELPTPAHYTHSKIGAWAALDRALRLVELDQLEGDTDRWRREQGAIRQLVETRCWSPVRRSFMMTAGGDELDAACLLAGRMGFATPDQLEGTVAAVRAELGRGPFLWRTTGLRHREGAFLACSFWLVDALARLDLVEEAEEVFCGALAAANDLGLLSEEHDPATGAALGNVPQALSHLSLVNAATVLDDRRGRRAGDAGARLSQGTGWRSDGGDPG